MPDLIGDLPVNVYDNFIYQSKQNKVSLESKYALSIFNLNNCQSIVILINRLVYFILHHFSTYPNNKYLFNKFITHDFNQIKTMEQYQLVEKIFNKFINCLEIDENKLLDVKKQLDAAKKLIDDLVAKAKEQQPLEENRRLEDNSILDETILDAYSNDDPPDLHQSEKDDFQKDNANEESVDSNSQSASRNPQEKDEIETFDIETLFKKEKAKGEKRNEIKADEKIENNPSQKSEDPVCKDELLKKPLINDEDKTTLPTDVRLVVEQPQIQYKSFDDYLKEADKSFTSVWENAWQEASTLHQEFKNKFSNDHAPRLMDDGEVICTAAQLDWVIQKIISQFPAIYKSTSGVPALDIYQSKILSLLATRILIDDIDLSKYQSSCFIHLQETVHKSTPVIEIVGSKNPSSKTESYIYANFVQTFGPFTYDIEKRKQQMDQFAAVFVKEWFEKRGASLQFGGRTIHGGQETETIKSSQWVAEVRDLYTQTLLGMSAEDLNNEIKDLYNCPLVEAMIKTFAHEDGISKDDWSASYFPASLMKKMFDRELARVQNNPSIHQGISNTIKDACFSDSTILQKLCEKSGRQPNEVEPLIRFRVMYLMSCLGQSAIIASKGMVERAQTMYDPNFDGHVLYCNPDNDRTLSFDDKFDRLILKVKTVLKDVNTKRDVAQGQSVLEINSISSTKQNELKIKIIDLEELSFSVYATKRQRRYLSAQAEPATFLNHIKRLQNDFEKLTNLKKNKRDELKKKDEKFWHILDQYDNRIFNQFANTTISFANVIIEYTNTYLILEYKNQLSAEQVKGVRETLKSIREQIINEVNDLNDPNKEGHGDSKVDQDKVTQLRKILLVEEKHVGVIHPDLKVISNPTYVDIEEEDEDVIGKTAGNDPKGFVGYIASILYQNSIGYVVKESSEVKYIKWKIDRYEDLIRSTQQSFLDYIKTAHLGTVDQLIDQAKGSNPPEWILQLLPILKLCRKGIRDDDMRYNPIYLQKVRDTHLILLQKLRDASIWAKANPTSAGKEHVDAFCYHLYATINLNQRCEDIYQTFTTLGEAELKRRGNDSNSENLHDKLPDDPRYDLIRNLHKANRQIKAVPNDAKAPLLKQWLNSFRGHFNGIPFLTTFDPAMQSNPMHVLVQKTIKIKGNQPQNDIELTVKDIAMGSPTIEDGINDVKISPEFEGFLRHCQRMNLRHFYYNNQNFIPKSRIKGDDSKRCYALHHLAKTEFKDTLVMITMSQNSAFYNQLGHQLKGLNVQAIKKQIVDQLLTNKIGNYLPSQLTGSVDFINSINDQMNQIHIKDFANVQEFASEAMREKFVQSFHDQLRKHLVAYGYSDDDNRLGYSIYNPSAQRYKHELINQMFDLPPEISGNNIPDDLVKLHDLRNWGIEASNQIHKIMFGNRTELTVHERRVFNRLFYQNLAKKILVNSQANSYNMSCKDRIDRGAESDAEDLAEAIIRQDDKYIQDTVKFFEIMVFARAIIVRKRTIIEERLHRLYETAKFMLDHRGELIALHHNLFPNVEITITPYHTNKIHG